MIEPLRELLAELGEEEGNPTSGPILRGVKGKPLSLDMLTSVTIRPALHNRANYRDGEAKNWKPLEWHGFYALRRGIATHLNTITRGPMAAKGLLRHSIVSTTLAHYIKDVPEITANGMAQVEQLFGAVTGECLSCRALNGRFSEESLRMRARPQLKTYLLITKLYILAGAAKSLKGTVGTARCG